MDTALSEIEITAKENNGRQLGGDPAVAKLQSRWKSAVKKASAQTSAEASNTAPDADYLMESAFAHASETMPVFEETPSQPASRPGGLNVVQPRAWHTLRPSQLRKVDRGLARMQQAWLAPSISGYFMLNDQSIEWQLSLPQPIINPVVVQIGYQPMVIDEHADLPLDEPSSREKVATSTGFSLSFGAESFLLNWIPAPWQALSADAKHALLQVAVSPLVEALGLALDDHWNVVGIEERREKSGQDTGGTNANALNIAALSAMPHGAVALAPDEAAKVSIGVAFRRTGVEQIDTATLSVPETWLERFLAQRHDTSHFCSMKSLLAAYPHIGDMQHTLPVVVGELPLDVQSVRGLDVGDVIFFATHHGSLADLWRSPGLKARIDAPSAIIELVLNNNERSALVRSILPRPVIYPAGRRVSSFLDNDAATAPHFSSTRESHQSPMENTSTPGVASPDAPTMADHLATLPIAITIEVGELSMPLSALSDIAVGTTLALAKPLDEHLLTIRANGHAIAFGELVMLDNEVGVRVKRLSSLGASQLDRMDDHAQDTHNAPAFVQTNSSEGDLNSPA
jgi:flagellar motor switch/type III secretory pathway protein FliN